MVTLPCLTALICAHVAEQEFSSISSMDELAPVSRQCTGSRDNRNGCRASARRPQRGAHYLLRVLAELPIKSGLLCSDAALEDVGISRAAIRNAPTRRPLAKSGGTRARRRTCSLALPSPPLHSTLRTRHNHLGPRAYQVLTACVLCLEINRAGDVRMTNRVKVVPLAGLEPARCCHHLILSQARLPIPPQGLVCDHSGEARGVNGPIPLPPSHRYMGRRSIGTTSIGQKHVGVE
jgi:hypothetical protein